jgi:hypothetical protein
MTTNASAKIESSGNKENNEVSPFTEILSKAADDPGLKEKPVKPIAVVKKPELVLTEKKDEPAILAKETKSEKPATNTETVVVSKEEKKSTGNATVTTKPVSEVEKPIVQNAQSVVDAKTVETEEPAKISEELVIEKPSSSPAQNENVIQFVSEENKNDGSEVVVVSSQVKKWSESSTTEGFGLVFIDNYENGDMDTIRLIIPNPKPIEVAVSSKKSESKVEKKFIEIDDPEKEKKEDTNLAEVKTVISNHLKARIEKRRKEV